MINKIFDFLKLPGYVEIKEVKMELSTEELQQLIQKGKVRMRKDGHVEIIDGSIHDLTPSEYNAQK